MEKAPVKDRADFIFFESHLPAYTCYDVASSSPISSHSFYFDMESHEVTRPWGKSTESFFSRLTHHAQDYASLTKFSNKILRTHISKISKEVFTFNPSKFAIQPTYDGSILFSFKIDNTQFHLEYYLNYIEEELDEVVLTGISNKKVTVDFAGDLDKSFRHLIVSKPKLHFISDLNLLNAPSVSTNTFAPVEL